MVMYFRPCFRSRLKNLLTTQKPELVTWLKIRVPAPMARAVETGSRPSISIMGATTPTAVTPAVVMEPTAVIMMAPTRNGISRPGTPESWISRARSLMPGKDLMTWEKPPPMAVTSRAIRATSMPRAIQLFRTTSRKHSGSLPVASRLLLRTEALWPRARNMV